jgi:hypothetical protein
MYLHYTDDQEHTGFIRSSTLILIAFGTAFLPRIFETAGFPSVVNFIHFVTIPLACIVTLTTARLDRQQKGTVDALLGGLLVLFIVMLASALINAAGLINVAVDYLLLAEPFLLFLCLASLPLTPQRFFTLQTWLYRFCFFHIFLIILQFIAFRVLGLSILEAKPNNPDYVQGIFYHSGAGHVVGASVSLSFGLYFFLAAKQVALPLRLIVFGTTFWGMLVSDAKQVLLAFLVAGVLLWFTQLRDLAKGLQYFCGGVAIAAVLLWCVQNVPAFDAFNTWIRPEIYGPNGEATLLKTAAFRIIPAHYENFLQPWLGLGPGHTIGRLGGWMLREYGDLLGPLGSTKHPVTQELWRAIGQSWLGNQSSMFSPMFGWAGIWGDLGLLGLLSYFYLALVVWWCLCLDNISKFLLLTIAVFGLIFSQMEEPAYMLSITFIIGLQWHQSRLRQQATDYQLSYSDYSEEYLSLPEERL